MSEREAPSVLRALTKRLLTGLAAVVILLAVALGGFRLLMTQLPSYQDELASWIDEALGVELRFARVDARWSLYGPQLKFYGASMATAGQGAPIVTAREADVGLSALALLIERRLEVTRLTLDGTQLTVVRAADGSLRLQNVATPQMTRGSGELAHVKLLVRNSELLYVDERSGGEWQFEDVSVDLGREGDRVQVEATARLPAALGSRIDLSAEGRTLDPDDWRMFVAIRDAELAGLSRLAPDAPLAAAVGGRGDVSVWLDLADGSLARATVELAADDVRLPGTDAVSPAVYERVDVTAEWQRAAEGWSLALSNLGLTRNGSAWPRFERLEVAVSRADGTVNGVTLRSDFLRLEDITPIVGLLPDGVLADAWRMRSPRGDVRNVELRVTRAAGGWEYAVAGQFVELGFAPYGGLPGFSGLGGEVRADARSGRLALTGTAVELRWPDVFAAPLPASVLAANVVWRQGQNGFRIVSDDLEVGNADLSVRSNLELTLPADGGSPVLELEANLSGFDALAIERYLPVRKMPSGVVNWLSRSVRSGHVRGARLTLVGPLRSLPFAADEGELRFTADVENGVLDFLDDWPAAEGLTGTIEFRNTSFAARGAGRVLGNESTNVRVGIADMRNPILTLSSTTVGPLADVLAFLNGAPLIARHLGPDFGRLHAEGGTGEVTFDLRLPLRNRADFDLAAELRLADVALAVEGLAPRATEIEGLLTVRDKVVRGEGIRAIFLNGPVLVNVAPADRPGYRTRLEAEGEVTADAVAQGFGLPFGAYLAGQTRWQGELLLPDTASSARAPAVVNVTSNLDGVAMRFPAPLAKSPSDLTRLEVELAFSGSDRMDVVGYLGATRRFALRFGFGAQGLEFDRGELRFGGELPELPQEPGLRIRGQLGLLALDEWLRSPHVADSVPVLDATLLSADLEVADFSAFGQALGSTRFRVARNASAWQIDIESEPILGGISVPRAVDERLQISAEMQRLNLSAGDSAGPAARPSVASDLDPRKLPGLALRADQFAIGTRRFGTLRADIQADPLGLRLVSFETAGESFSMQGSGGWVQSASGPITRLAFSLASGDVAATLAALGFDPVAEAESAELSASLHWRGAPLGNWLEHLNGDLAVRLSEGSILDIEPGAGRMMGLMSISALPRRLALDFRDVFNRGLVFDEVGGDFAIIEGDAYTNNLKVTGPIAEIGVIGRTGLRQRDYEQQAVVTAEPGKMLPTVGGLLAGTGVGAALLIFTRIFKEPLRGIGRASYCVTGSWDAPSVERLSAEDLEAGRLCAALPPDGLTMVAPDDGTR